MVFLNSNHFTLNVFILRIFNLNLNTEDDLHHIINPFSLVNLMRLEMVDAFSWLWSNKMCNYTNEQSSRLWEAFTVVHNFPRLEPYRRQMKVRQCTRFYLYLSRFHNFSFTYYYLYSNDINTSRKNSCSYHWFKRSMYNWIDRWNKENNCENSAYRMRK